MKNLIKKITTAFKDKYFRLDLLTFLGAFIIFVDTLTIDIHAGFYVLAVIIGVKVALNYYIYTRK